jgi:hypothetical protein
MHNKKSDKNSQHKNPNFHTKSNSNKPQLVCKNQIPKIAAFEKIIIN